MPSWRLRRQLSALAVFGAAIGGIALVIAFRFIPASTCFDNRQNQGEHGTDCGGPCAACELKNPKPVSILWVRPLPVDVNTYDVAALVVNQNEILGASRVEYEVTLFDSLGPVARALGDAFLLPQEKLVLIEPSIKTTREATQAEVRILAAAWVVREKPAPDLVVERRDYRVEERAGRKRSVVEAHIFNSSLFDIREAEVRIALFDDQGNAIGVNKLFLRDLPAGERKIVLSLWPRELAGEIKAIEVDARVNVFDPLASGVVDE